VGNAALEEFVMAPKTRQDFYDPTTTIKTERPCPMSLMVSTVTGLEAQSSEAIVGQDAFVHEAGIHQDGMLTERSTSEIMRSEEVGVPKTDLILGKDSGRHALRDRHECDPDRHRLDPLPRRGPDPRRAIGDGTVDATFKAVERVTGSRPSSASSPAASRRASPSRRPSCGGLRRWILLANSRWRSNDRNLGTMELDGKGKPPFQTPRTNSPRVSDGTHGPESPLRLGPYRASRKTMKDAVVIFRRTFWGGKDRRPR
jgi:hypothetical protein